MNKRNIILGISILLFSCGSNAENSTVEIATAEKIVLKQDAILDDKAVVTVVQDGVVEEGIVEDVEKEEFVEPVVVEKPLPTEQKKHEEEVLQVVETKIIRAQHSAWDGLTKKYVTSTGKVNYKGMKTELVIITDYLAHLNENTPQNDWTKNEKLAYWINLYNASTVYLIASNYPVSSITKINGGKPWDKKFVKSGGKTYSLNDIEHKMIRPVFNDPRVHAALNCAAVSCPKLLNSAYTATQLDAQLNQQTKAWLNDVAKNKIAENKVQISQLFDWYKVDFKGGVIAFINKYAAIKVNEKAKITYLSYNWDLND